MNIQFTVNSKDELFELRNLLLNLMPLKMFIEPNEQPTKMLIEDLYLTVRATNCLRAEDIYTVEQLVDKTRGQLMQIPNFGKSCLKEVEKALNRNNLSLKVKI